MKSAVTNLKNGSRCKFYAFVTFILILILGVYGSNIASFLSPSLIQEKFASIGTVAPLAFILFYGISTFLLLPGTPFSIASGILFGPYLGTIYMLIAATAGSIGEFYLARHFGAPFVNRLLKTEYHRLDRYDEKLAENGLPIVLLMRILPSPFGATSYAFGLTRVKFSHYLLGTSIGLIPGTFAYAYLGSSIASFNPWKIAAAVAILSVLTILFYFYKKRENKIKS